MKTALKLFLWALAILFSYQIYLSVNAPIEFDKVKQERFSAVINTLKDIRNAQEAYKTVNNKYASDFKSLIAFVETGNYTITQQRDSSYTVFDKAYGISVLKEVRIIDTLGTVSVKDSLFKGSDRFKNLMKVPFGQNGEEFKLEAKVIEKGGYRAPVFLVSVEKNVVLYDQPEDLVAKENAALSVEQINGTAIKVGSLDDVSTSGNWPPIYDKKKNN